MAEDLAAEALEIRFGLREAGLDPAAHEPAGAP
jgi:hypothetical protein